MRKVSIILEPSITPGDVVKVIVRIAVDGLERKATEEVQVLFAPGSQRVGEGLLEDAIKRIAYLAIKQAIY